MTKKKNPQDEPAEKRPRYQLHSMNAFIDGIIINDFESDEEAASYAANYEARCYRINPDGTRGALVYDPADSNRE